VHELRRALAAAPASLVMERLARHLAADFGVNDAELLLVDYRLRELLPLRRREGAKTGGSVAEPDAIELGTAPGGAAWRAFDDQQPSVDTNAIYVPVSVRGERFGVLRMAPASTRTHADELAEWGSILAHELAAANSITDRYVVGARARRLTLAAEMQWEMLPGRSCVADQFTLAGQLEPAYAVKGDCFDWALGTDRLSISVIDGMGEGVGAAALSILGKSALRNARRAGLDLASQASMADSALYSQYRGAAHLSALLLEIELETGRVNAIDTGSPMLMIIRGEDLSEVRLAAHDPFGMFDGSQYASEEFLLEPGDRLVIVSDGIHAATSGQQLYAEAALRRLLKRTRRMQPLAVVRTLVSDLLAYGSGELSDDAAAICLDWHGSANQ
jgi:Stage II sporulation protein E (SpoIIE)